MAVMPFAIGSSGAIGGAALGGKWGGAAIGGNVIFSAETVQEIALLASTYRIPRAQEKDWRFPFRSEPQIDASFVPDGTTRYLLAVDLVYVPSTPYRSFNVDFISQRGRTASGQDLSSDFETRGAFTLTLSTGESLTVNMADNTDRTEIYILTVFEGGSSAFDRVWNALSTTAGSESATLTLTLPA